MLRASDEATSGSRHAERGPDLAVQQRRQPLPLLFGRAELLQDLHVRHVRRVAVEHDRRPGQPAHDRRQRREFEIGQPRARLVGREVRQAEIPEAAPARFRLQRLEGTAASSRAWATCACQSRLRGSTSVRKNSSRSSCSALLLSENRKSIGRFAFCLVSVRALRCSSLDDVAADRLLRRLNDRQILVPCAGSCGSAQCRSASDFR